MLSSIQVGFDALPPETTAVLINLGDQPLIPHTILDRLIEAYDQTHKGIILPVYQMRRGHPILIDMKYKEEALNLSPDIGLRALVHNHPDDIQEVEVNTPHILKDIDNPEDYARELKKKEDT
jgi:molybdenum cofactor cytidylyltransferase